MENKRGGGIYKHSCQRSIDIKSGRAFLQVAKMGPKLALLIALTGALEVIAEKEHVHFKIHVPEIIKHHEHTHTIVIHVHHQSKKKKPSHFHNQHDGWYTYSQHTGHHGEYGGGKNYDDHNRVPTPVYPALVTYRAHQSDTTVPYYDDFTGDAQYAHNPDSFKNDYEEGVPGYAHPLRYTTGHYEVTESPEEAPASYERTTYDQSHKSGGEIIHGHVHENKSNSFYRNKIEESSEKTKKQSSEENFKFPGIDYMKQKLG
ncbi:uncharacterized protein [Fopius arisanus]|uniref:CEP63 protein n=1 Tax=Fopius arisanus TaxID=64838 RepID=A0A0C9QZU8_9HYME|nr:PREDICTED: uncharacterized protein LOC105264756 [Fopius arisanus]